MKSARKNGKSVKNPCTFDIQKRGGYMSYKSKDRKTGELFKELLPYGGKLNPNNRWMKLHDLIPWEELENIYKKYFSDLGRPGKDSQLVNGLMVVKHQKVISDEETIKDFTENPYIQFFCGYEQFVTEKEIDSSTLTRMRKRLGVEYFKKFEEEILNLLKERKIIKDTEQMVDATVFPANVTHPTDTGLLEKVRVWLVEKILEIKKKIKLKETIRTYSWTARKVYLKFQKKRKKKTKEIRKATKQLLQYVRRNKEQLKKLLERAGDFVDGEIARIKEKLKYAEAIYRQQLEMHKKKVHSIEDRIVSFHKPHIRPIVRGKSGKEVEFGPKASVSLVDGYLFLDKFSTDAYNEGAVLSDSLKLHKERFGKKPEVVITDRIYASKKNREMLGEEKIKAAFVPLGRKSLLTKKIEKWVKQKQRKRNQIEGFIGVSKVHRGLERLLFKNEELNIRLGLIAMNLSTAMARI